MPIETNLEQLTIVYGRLNECLRDLDTAEGGYQMTLKLMEKIAARILFDLGIEEDEK